MSSLSFYAPSSNSLPPTHLIVDLTCSHCPVSSASPSGSSLSRELLLITGLELFGIGNWQEVAEHVGTRFKDECEKHYLETYLGEKGGVRRQMPVSASLQCRDKEVREV